MAIIDISEETSNIAKAIERIQTNSQQVRPLIDTILRDLSVLFDAQNEMKPETRLILNSSKSVEKTTGIYLALSQILKTIDG